MSSLRLLGFNFWVVLIFLAGAFIGLVVYGEEDELETKPRVVYPKETKLDFSGAAISGELNNSSEFYFKFRKQEEFGPLLKRRPNFHREMLRDSVMGR